MRVCDELELLLEVAVVKLEADWTDEVVDEGERVVVSLLWLWWCELVWAGGGVRGW